MRTTDQMNDLTLLSSLIGEQSASNLMAHYGSLAGIISAGYEGLVLDGHVSAKVAEKLAIAAEIARRAAISNKRTEIPQITGVESAAALLKPIYEGLTVEEFHVIYMNRANRVQAIEKTSQGGLTGTVADPRLIIRRALSLNSTGLIISHNHPSGNLRPSRADEELTIKIREAARFFDLKVHDHVIIGKDGFYSFAEEGLI